MKKLLLLALLAIGIGGALGGAISSAYADPPDPWANKRKP